MFHKVILNNGKNKCVVEMGLSFFWTNEFCLMMVSIKKTNDGRTTWIVQRNEKNDRFLKSNGLKLLDIFTEWPNFLADFVKNDHFYLTNGFFDQSEIDFSDLFF